MFFENGPKDFHIEALNSSGSDWNFGDLILFGGVFGNVTSKDGILDTERGDIDGTPYRRIETDQLDGGGTFALDSFVYSEPGKDDLLDAPTASTWRVGIVVRAKGSNTTAEIKTLVPQIETV